MPTATSRDRPSEDPIALRIQARRRLQGLSLAALARRAGIQAASFLHHIEHGQRLPSEEVAARVARALGDDEELYRAWVRLRAGAELSLALEAGRTLERHLEPAPAPAAAPPSALLRIPLLAPGSDPGTLAEPARDAVEILRFDPASLPREAWLRPYAYRFAASDPLPSPLRAHDLVLITRNAWPIQRDALYVVRSPGGIVLSQLEWRAGKLWQLAEGRAAEPLVPSGTPPRALLGRVAAVIQAGPGAPEGR